MTFGLRTNAQDALLPVILGYFFAFLLQNSGYTDNGQVDPDDLLKGNNAAKLKKMVEDYGLFISATSNHADTMTILGEGKSVAHICDGTPEEQHHSFAALALM